MSEYKFEIGDNCLEYRDFILHIKKHFSSNNNSIHKARNEIKIIDNLVVKSFKIPSLFNRFIYTFFRATKAQKSYDYALRIADFTPKPIGYIEFYKNSLLDESYFISEHFNYDFTIREPLLDKNFQNRDEIFKAFAKFTFRLHENDIYHLDYSPGNILIKQDNDEYIFKIVDINRMEFRKLCFELRMKNFSKLWISDDDLTVVVDEYAKISGAKRDFLLPKALKYSHKHKAKINFKKRLKGQKVVD